MHHVCKIYIIVQKYELIKNIEKLSFWSSDNQKLHFDKRELLAQINYLNISISGNGFFKVDRQFLARVSFSPIYQRKNVISTFQFQSSNSIQCKFATLIDSARNVSLLHNLYFQMAAACCTYIIIFIQFYLCDKYVDKIQLFGY